MTTFIDLRSVALAIPDVEESTSYGILPSKFAVD